MATVNVVRKRSIRVSPVLRFRFDYWLLLAIAGMLVLGMLMVYSTTFDYGLRFQDDPTFYFRRQMMALGLGLVAMVGVMQFDYHILRRFSVPILGVTLVALLFVLFFTATSELGAQRGLYDDSYQPSEVAKLAMIIYISHWLSSKGDRIKMLTYGLLPFSVIVGVVAALIVRQPALSTAALITLVSFTLFFVAGADWRQFAAAGVLGSIVFVILSTTLPHAQARVNAYTQGLSDPAQSSWHVQQSLIALGRGGLFGVGLGESTQKFGPLPFAHTDGVFAILGEELGLAGALLLITLLGIFLWRGLRTAVRARDSFGSLLALGITCWIVFQAFINMAVITAVIPFTGVPLPFMSYGGTSLAVSLLGAGVLLNISRDSALEKRPQTSDVRERPQPTTISRRGKRPSATDRF